jgi:hypothetical protein
MMSTDRIFSISLGALARIEGTNKQGWGRRVRPDFTNEGND